MHSNTKILIVDDIKDMRIVLTKVLKKEGYKTITAGDGLTAIKLVRSELPDAVIMDIKMPKMDGIEVMKRIKKLKDDIPVILITAYGEIETAVQTVKSGAYDYVTKPFDNAKIIITLNNALKEHSLKYELKRLRLRLKDKAPLPKQMGSSNQVKRVANLVNSVSHTNFTVILYGETGSGKELVARSIHNQSLRRKNKFIAVDCGAIPETLIESELFGYEKGAFTGAEGRREGYFELASKGTLFLDEIGNLPVKMQNKLLRVLEGHNIRRLGGRESIEVDIRVIVASNSRLDRLVKTEKFREDLYHRLNEFTIEIPPLRNRKEDIIYLANRFLDECNLELNKNVQGLSESALERMNNYDWPGNVRELRNVIRRAALVADDKIESVNIPTIKSRLNIDSFDSPISHLINGEKGTFNEFSLKDIVKKGVSNIEKYVITDTLQHTGGNKSKAARILKIDYKTLYYKIKEYDIKFTP
ncbi:MAG: sigma-54-dependent transcriptional regulator [Candidatus Scalinduaceae bacterium]